MKVVAKSIGYYDLKRRREGDVFLLRPMKQSFIDKDGKKVTKLYSAEEQFTPSWMEKFDDEEDAPPVRSAKASRTKKAIEIDTDTVTDEAEDI